MFKVLIVDDEEIMRNGLKTLINWRHYGFEICGDAHNGRDAIQKIATLKPDLAIVDIRMPIMDGLMLSEYIHQQNLGIKIIILSGYSQFEYAKTAMKYGVYAYLLKPIEEDELIQELQNVYQQIIQEKNLGQLISDGLELSQDRQMQNILLGTQIGESFSGLCSSDVHRLPWDYYQVVLVDTKTTHVTTAQLSAVRMALRQFTELTGSTTGIDFEINSHAGILFQSQDLWAEHPQILALYTMLLQTTPQFTIVIGDGCNTFYEIPKSYQSALRLMSKGFFLEDLPAIDSGTVLSFLDQNPLPCLGNFVCELVTCIASYNKERAAQVIQSLKLHMAGYDMPIESAKSLYANIVVSVLNALNPNHFQSTSLLFGIYTVHQEIGDLSTIRQIEQYTLNRIVQLMQEQPQKQSQHKLSEVIEYIRQNLDKDLKLEYLAKHFGYNSSYLGKVFKEATGEAFNTYLDKLRMQKALEHIKEGCFVYEAAQRIGYTNLNYFHLKFKKYIGVAPGSIKRTLRT